MLNEIFNNYSEKKSLFPKLKEEKNIELSKEELKNKKDTFLNEEEIVSSKKKVEETLSKYCTLYEKNSLKPLNIEYINKKKNRENLNNTTGPKWFNMKAPELTTELKQELKAVQLGKLSEPFQFHKKSDRKGYAKFFQIGTIQDNILDGKANRLKKSEIKNRIAEQLLDFDKEQNFTLRKFNEYQEQRKKLGIKKSKLNKFKLKSKGKKIGVGVVSKS